MLENKRNFEKKQKDVLTLRMPTKINQYTKAKAEAIGISQAAFLNILIDLGLGVYESDSRKVKE